MNKQELILMYLRDHKSKRAIVRETGFARKTVEKYINLMKIKKKTNRIIKASEKENIYL